MRGKNCQEKYFRKEQSSNMVHIGTSSFSIVTICNTMLFLFDSFTMQVLKSISSNMIDIDKDSDIINLEEDLPPVESGGSEVPTCHAHRSGLRRRCKHFFT